MAHPTSREVLLLILSSMAVSLQNGRGVLNYLQDFLQLITCQVGPKITKKFEFICRQPIPTLPPKPSRLHAPTPTKILTLKTDYKTHNCSPSHASMPM